MTDQAPPDLSQPAVTMKLSYRGMDCALKAFSKILSNVRLLLTWLISTNMDFTGSVAFQPFLRAFLSSCSSTYDIALILMRIKPLSTPLIDLLVVGHINCVSEEAGGSVFFLYAHSNQVIIRVFSWTIVPSVAHATINLFHIIACEPRLSSVSSDISSSARCLSCWLARLSGYPCCSLGQQVSFRWTLLSNLSGSAQG